MADREKEQAPSGDEDLLPERNEDQPQQDADEKIEEEAANLAANILQNLNVNPNDVEIIVEVDDRDNKDSGAETEDEGTGGSGDSSSDENVDGYILIHELRNVRLDSRVRLFVDEQLLDPQALMQFARYEHTSDEESESEEQNEQSGEKGNAKSGELATVEEAER